MLKIFLCFLPIYFVLMQSSLAQQKSAYFLKIQIQDNLPKSNKKKQAITTFNDSLVLLKALQEKFLDFQNQGYLLAKKDSIIWKKDTLNVYFDLGEKFYWTELQTGTLSKQLLNGIHFKEKNYAAKPFIYRDLELLKKQILINSENNGFPFASIGLDSISMSQNAIKARLNYQSNTLIIFDTLQIIGNLKIRRVFLQRYLKIQPNQIFNQSKINDAERLLKQLPFLQLLNKPSTVFLSNRAFVQLQLKQKKANQIDGFLGILPNAEKQNQVLLTGELNLNLKNLFQSAKSFKAKWQRLQTSSQRLYLEFDNPVLWKSNFDVRFNFSLLRQDSSFVKNELKMALFYNLPNSGKLIGTLSRLKSNLGDANFLITAEKLPDFSEVNYLNYGLGYEWNNLDDIFYPHRGTKIAINASIGQKNILKNPFLDENLYSEIALKSTQSILTAEITSYIALSKQNVLLGKLQGGVIYNPHLFLNDLFRLGGLNSLRGHNENIFYASNYGIATLEYRFFMGEDSFINLFYEQAFIQSKSIDLASEDFPLGIGAGISFGTQAGVFNLVYALGKSKEQNLTFNQSKIHFGLVSRF